ncbi:MAG: Flp pilus assembly protein CpaB [Thermaurantiacus sp.]
MSPRLLRLAPRGLFLLFLALALGASAVWLTASWLDRAARASATAARNAAAVDTVELFVARRDLQPGDVISREMLGLAKWPRNALQPQHLRAEEVPAEKLFGSIVRASVAQGQPLNSSHLVQRGQQGVLAALIAPGKRAVTIPVSAAAGLAGLVGPGDRVDVLLTATTSGSRRVVGLTVVENVRVLGVDQRLRPMSAGAEGAPPPSTVTLEVSPRDAEAIAVAQELGRLSLALRNLSPRAEAPSGAGRTWDTDVTRLTAGDLGAASAAVALAPSLAAAPAVPPAAAALPDAPAASSGGTGTATENGVQVVRGDSIRSSTPPPADEGGT